MIVICITVEAWYGKVFLSLRLHAKDRGRTTRMHRNLSAHRIHTDSVVGIESALIRMSSNETKIALSLSLVKALQYHEDYAEALASYERALEIDSENDDARNNQEQLLSYLRTITDLLSCKVSGERLRWGEIPV